MEDNDRMMYSLGQRDMMASILADHHKEVKLKKLAEEYKEKFEEHFSHKWHTS